MSDPVEAARARLEAWELGPEPLNAFISTRFEQAAEESAPEGEGPLAGLPVAVKDNLATLDLPTTCASRILAGYRSPYEATAVERLRVAGAVVVGKTNLDEFAMGSSTEHSAHGATLNPRERQRVPGGSSGGSAAAVAAGIVPAALGSETGGSVRQPASFCGVVGIKPTYGRVSRSGLVAFASSLDQVGVFGRTVADAARVLEAISGADPRDATCSALPPPRAAAALAGRLDGVVVGVPAEYLGDDVHPAVRAAVRQALRRLEQLGAELRDLSLPHTRLALPAYHVIAPAEASSNLARYDGLRFGAGTVRGEGADAAPADPDELYERTRALFGAEVRRRILVGTLVLSTGSRERYYDRARLARELVAEDFRNAFGSGVHALFTPTTPAPAFALGERLRDPVGMYLSDAFTVAANLAGIPALSLPIGADGALPVGGQIMAPHWAEETLLRIAAALEAALPPLVGPEP